MIDISRYPRNVFWSDEDEGYIALAPDLQGCSAFGETESEALTELRDAMQAWIVAAQEAGNPVPEPSRPTVDPQASGKILLRMPRSLHGELVHCAKRDNVSLNHYLVYLITSAQSMHQWVRKLEQKVHALENRGELELSDQVSLSSSVMKEVLKATSYEVGPLEVDADLIPYGALIRALEPANQDNWLKFEGLNKASQKRLQTNRLLLTQQVRKQEPA